MLTDFLGLLSRKLFLALLTNGITCIRALTPARRSL